MERLILQRLTNQKLLQPDLHRPPEIVRWLGAVQSQDFAGAKWALAQRAGGLTDAAIERAYDSGAILRTHVMRPTWHFVTPADIGWLLTLTAPRVQRFNAHAYRTFELDARIFSRARTLLARALEGGEALTRSELAAALGRGRIVARGPRLAMITIDAELNQVMCSGPMRGTQFTYASFASRVPRPQAFTREEALAELTRRYFASHGPATFKDFSWWSGLTLADVKLGVELVGSALVREPAGGVDYWMMPCGVLPRPRGSKAWLLPNYDEYLIAYKDRGMYVGSGRAGRDPYPYHIIIDGLLAGSWKPTVTTGELRIDANFYSRPTADAARALERAAARYGEFVGKRVTIYPSRP